MNYKNQKNNILKNTSQIENNINNTCKSGNELVSPLKFALLTFLITYVCWGIILIANQYGFLEYGTPLMMVFFITGGISPAIVAIALLLKTKSTKGKGLMKRIFDFRQPPILYIIIIGIAVLQYMVPLLLNIGTKIAPFYMIILSFPFVLIGGGLEEIGWRFIFQPTLERKMPFVAATIITSIVWSLWHLPLFVMVGTSQYSWNFLYYTIRVIGLAFILAAIYRVSKSVLLCILYHTMVNAVGGSISINMDFGTSLVTCIALIALSFLLIKIFEKKKEVNQEPGESYSSS